VHGAAETGNGGRLQVVAECPTRGGPNPFEPALASLRALLLQDADPDTQAWWDRYVKESAPFMGLKMSTTRKRVQEWHEARVAGWLDPDQQVDLALALFGGTFTEEKLAGTLFLAEILLPTSVIVCQRDLARFAELFAEGRIADWNVCDWFCVKVLGPLIQRYGVPCAREISAWRSAENLWQARASAVAFVRVADELAYRAMIEASCRDLIRREERFAQTAVGCVLREVSKHDDDFVRHFVSEHLSSFSAESLGNATKSLGKDERKHYRRLLKEAQAAGKAPGG